MRGDIPPLSPVMRCLFKHRGDYIFSSQLSLGLLNDVFPSGFPAKILQAFLLKKNPLVLKKKKCGQLYFPVTSSYLAKSVLACPGTTN
jgi:hypothetical protein